MDPVDLALVLAFDASASVTFDEFNLIAGGCAAALRDPDVLAGLTAGPNGAALATLVIWSGVGAHAVSVDWTHITDAASLGRFARAVDDTPRLVRAGTTALGEALAFCEALLAAAPAASGRQVIDIAGDGRANDGELPGPVRDRLAAAGVTVNGLCVLHEEPDLLAYYEAEVIGGPAAFALACPDYAAFADALRQKLRREVAVAHPNRPATRA